MGKWPCQNGYCKRFMYAHNKNQFNLCSHCLESINVLRYAVESGLVTKTEKQPERTGAGLYLPAGVKRA